MKPFDIVLLSLSLALLVIGIDQTIVLGFSSGYWAFMLALTAFFLFAIRKTRKQEAPKNKPGPSENRKR